MVFRELSFSRLEYGEYGVHDRLHIYPLCGVFYFPWHRHQIEGTNGFYCHIRKTERFTISNVESQVFTPNNKAVRQSPDLLFIATSFWFEESPSAVRTNTAGLGRLCTLFVCSTLLVFEHTHAVLSSTLVLCCTMVTTSTAAMSNSRYADTDRMKNVFLIRFSKPHLDRTKAGR